MATAKVSETVNANADKVFAVLGDFGGLKLDLIEAVKLTGSGIGCSREVTLTNGARVVERLDNHDMNTRTQTYSIQNDDHPLPFKAYVATFVVTPTGANSCRVDWFSNFDVKSGTEAEAVKFAQGLYTGLIQGMTKQLTA